MVSDNVSIYERWSFGLAVTLHALILGWNPVLWHQLVTSPLGGIHVELVEPTPPPLPKPAPVRLHVAARPLSEGSVARRDGATTFHVRLPSLLLPTGPVESFHATAPVPIATTPESVAIPVAPALAPERQRHRMTAPVPELVDRATLHMAPSPGFVDPKTPRDIPDDLVPRRAAPPASGFELLGPLQDRSIVKKTLPVYPDWAEEQGISGIVKLAFAVTPDGTVKSTITLKQTSGEPRLDQLAIDALRGWRFTAQPGAAEQWGVITFYFSLRSGRTSFRCAPTALILYFG